MSDDGPDAEEHRVRRALKPRVLLAFDFDETLAPNTTDALLRHLGVDPDYFRERHVAPRVANGWEQRLAEAHALIELSRGDHGPITEQTFADTAAELDVYPGAEQMFDHLRGAVAEIDADLLVEFHLITAGFVHIPAHTSVGGRFDSLIGGHWAFDDDGHILAPKHTVGHYAKVRHLLALAKGLDSIASDRANDVYRELPES